MKTYPLPRFIQLYPTHRCNQDCSFCFNPHGPAQFDMTETNALRLLRILEDYSIMELDIMGGEPFLLQWMPPFLHEAVRRDIMVNVSTNGSFPEIMEHFRGVNSGKINIGISLEGSTASIHNRITTSLNFDKAVDSIIRLKELGLNPIVKTVVNKETMPDIPGIISLLSVLGVKRYYLIHMDAIKKTDSHLSSAISYPKFIEFFTKIKNAEKEMQINRVNASCFEKKSLPASVRCAGGVKKLAVMPDGSVHPCNLFQYSPEFILGNIFSDSLSEIWQNKRLSVFRNSENNKCSMTSCPNNSSCTGGCPAHSHHHNYDWNGTDIRCQEFTP